MATPDKMRAELDRLARKVRHLFGAESRHWSINADAGTVRSLNGGDLIIYVSHVLLDLGLEQEV